MFKSFGDNKEIARAMALYIGYSILGPILVLGGFGYFLDKIFETKLFVFIGLALSYITSQYLMFKKLKKINAEIAKHSPEEKKDEDIKKEDN